MSEYQKEQEAARKRQERREKRAERRQRRVMKQDTACLLDKMALTGAQEKIQDTLDAERDEFRPDSCHGKRAEDRSPSRRANCGPSQPENRHANRKENHQASDLRKRVENGLAKNAAGRARG